MANEQNFLPAKTSLQIFSRRAGCPKFMMGGRPGRNLSAGVEDERRKKARTDVSTTTQTVSVTTSMNSGSLLAHDHFVEVVELFGLDHAAHELEALEMGSRTHAHGNDIELGHLVENVLTGSLAVFFVKLSIREDNFVDEFAVCSSEGTMMLAAKQVSFPTRAATTVQLTSL